MKYLEYYFKEDKTYFYYEVGNDDYAIRTIIKTENELITSNKKHKNENFCLAEGKIKIDELNNVNIISEKKFNSIWKKNLDYNKWSKIKTKYCLNKKVEGKIEIFYPSKIIISLNDDTICTINNQCFNTNDYNKLTINNKIKGIVKGYDEINQWVILTNPEYS